MTQTHSQEDLNSLVLAVQALLEQAVTKESPTVQGLSDTFKDALFDAFKKSPGHFKGAMAEKRLHVVVVEDAADKNGYLIVSIDNRDTEPNEDNRRTLVVYSSKKLFMEMAEDFSPENMRRLKIATAGLRLRNVWQRSWSAFQGLWN